MWEPPPPHQAPYTALAPPPSNLTLNERRQAVKAHAPVPRAVRESPEPHGWGGVGGQSPSLTRPSRPAHAVVPRPAGDQGGALWDGGGPLGHRHPDVPDGAGCAPSAIARLTQLLSGRFYFSTPPPAGKVSFRSSCVPPRKLGLQGHTH